MKACSTRNLYTQNPDATLKQFAGGEAPDKLLVGVEEVKGGQVGALDPADLAKNSILELVVEMLDGEEMQVD